MEGCLRLKLGRAGVKNIAAAAGVGLDGCLSFSSAPGFFAKWTY
jgi:hypothetical protein